MTPNKETLPPDTLPQAGGSYVRGKDGKLTLANRTRSRAEAAASDMKAEEKTTGKRNPPASKSPAPETKKGTS